MTQLQEYRNRMTVLQGSLGKFLADAKDSSGELNVTKVDKIGETDVSKMSISDKLGEYRKLDAEMNDLAPQIETLAKIEIENENAKRAKIEKGSTGQGRCRCCPASRLEILFASQGRLRHGARLVP